MRPSEIRSFTNALPRIAQRFGATEPGRRMAQGERAALRRLDPARPESGIGAVCRLLLACGVEEVERWDAEGLRRAVLATHVLALLSGNGADPHAPAIRAGAGLAAAGLSEARFRRFLTARGSAFDDQAVRLARFLAGHAQRLDTRPVVELILLGDGNPQTEGWAEDIRLTLARDYYAALARNDAAA